MKQPQMSFVTKIIASIMTIIKIYKNDLVAFQINKYILNDKVELSLHIKIYYNYGYSQIRVNRNS